MRARRTHIVAPAFFVGKQAENVSTPAHLEIDNSASSGSQFHIFRRF
jgi:hypothetical protein